MQEPDTLAYDALDPAAKPYVDAAAKTLFLIEKGLDDTTQTPFDGNAEADLVDPVTLAEYRGKGLRIVRALSGVFTANAA